MRVGAFKRSKSDAPSTYSGTHYSGKFFLDADFFACNFTYGSDKQDVWDFGFGGLLKSLEVIEGH